MIARLGAWIRALGLIAIFLPALAQAAGDVVGMQLVSSSRVGRTTFDYTYTITVRNGSPALVAAKATVTSTAPATQIVKSTVSLGDVAAGATVASADTFTLRQDRSVPFNPASLVWKVSGLSLDVALSDAFVPPNGSVTAAPTLRDGNGTVVSSAGYAFDVSVTPVGTVFGASPVVNGLTVKFPRLVKKLLNANPTKDPDGLYADTDPTDPNFGKQTGGIYQVTVSIAGTPLSSSKNVTVLPTGTAQITYKGNQYAGQLGTAAALAAQARQTGSPDLLNQAKAALQTADANPDFSATTLSINSALAPPDGGLVTAAELASRGFTAGPQDAAFAAALAATVNRIGQARATLDAIDPSALNQSAVDALQLASNNYKSAVQTLQGLRPSTLGTHQQQDLINQAVVTELPRLLDSSKRLLGRMLSVPTHALIETPTRHAAADEPLGMLPAWSVRLGVPSVPLLRGSPRGNSQPAQPFAATTPSPAAMYASTEPTQFADFFFTSFQIMTDLAGIAKTNIYELSISLANDIINLELADYVNRNAVSRIGIDYCQGSASMSFICPNYSPSTIGGSGFGADPSAVQVILVGCVNSTALANALTLSMPKNIAQAITLMNTVVSTVQDLATNKGVLTAVVKPDSIEEDWFGGDRMLYFDNGFPRINAGRLPCVGTVIVMNPKAGGMGAANANFLASCG